MATETNFTSYICFIACNLFVKMSVKNVWSMNDQKSFIYARNLNIINNRSTNFYDIAVYNLDFCSKISKYSRSIFDK